MFGVGVDCSRYLGYYGWVGSLLSPLRCIKRYVADCACVRVGFLCVGMGLRFEFATNEYINDMTIVTLETAATETGTKDFIAVGTTIDRGEDLAVKGAVRVCFLSFPFYGQVLKAISSFRRISLKLRKLFLIRQFLSVDGISYDCVAGTMRRDLLRLYVG